MTIINKIQSSVLALGLGVSALPGCATTPKVTPEEKFLVPEGYSTRPLTNWKSEKETIKTLAGIYAGTVEVKRTASGGYFIKSRPSAHQDLHIYIERVLQEVDTNRDEIITIQELRDLEAKLFEEYSQ
ncbi:MAG: hypothetical protein Q8R37_02780 [Nanoarchaeota archaeon]|nr:hypothetical protein [Nanoarchaeota archaeon]